MAAKGMKSIAHNSGVLHVETPLGIINIRAGLADTQGRRVVAIETIPDRIGNVSVHVLPDGRIVEDTPGCVPLQAFPDIRTLRQDGRRLWVDGQTGEQISEWRGRFFAYARGAPAGQEIREITPGEGCKRPNACET